MNVKTLAAFVRSQGCPVRLYNKKILLGQNCAGLFDLNKRGRPYISVAMLGDKNNPLHVLLHEYCHFLQWKDGYMMKLEEPGTKDGWTILDDWIKGKEFSREQLRMARGAILLMEYDAELRTLQKARELGIKMNKRSHLKDSNGYIESIKKAFETRKYAGYVESKCDRVMTIKEVLDADTKPKRRGKKR